MAVMHNLVCEVQRIGKATVDMVVPSKLNKSVLLSSGFLTLLAVMCVIVNLELTHLVLAVGGATIYVILLDNKKPSKVKKTGATNKDFAFSDTEGENSAGEYSTGEYSAGEGRVSGTGGKGKVRKIQRRRGKSSRAPQIQLPDARQISKVPVFAPSFNAQVFTKQVDELLAQMTPSAEADQLVAGIAAHAEQAIKSIFPEGEVVGFATGDVVRGTAFGVAVPEVDIIASARPDILLEHLRERLWKGGMPKCKLDARKIQKSAIRHWTDLLVTPEVGFKFRRSAFRSQDPKVTLIAPSKFGVSGRAIPIDFSVNYVTPLHNMALITECKQIEPRAKELILLVKRWAKDRGVCHASKGHLAPYAWTLLAVYFLQVGVPGGPLLPPLQGFKRASGLAMRSGAVKVAALGNNNEWKAPTEGPAATMSVGELFQAFCAFYATEVDWRKEAVSVRLGTRSAPNLNLPLHIVVHSDQSTDVGPSIEDPFDMTRNIGTSITSLGMSRLHEELSRSLHSFQNGCSLSELLEPWAPPERSPVTDDEGEVGERCNRQKLSKARTKPAADSMNPVACEDDNFHKWGKVVLDRLMSQANDTACEVTENVVSGSPPLQSAKPFIMVYQ